MGRQVGSQSPSSVALVTQRIDQTPALSDILCKRKRRLSSLLNAHSLALSVIKRAISFGLNLHGPGTISCAALSASATILRAVACASAMMRSRSACAMATASATGSNVFAAAKASAGNRSTVRSAGAAASGALVVALSLPSSRATKTPVRSTAAIVSVETVPISSATGNSLRRARIAHISQGFACVTRLCDDPRCYWRPPRRRLPGREALA
jgi:hypothetical protein